MLFRSRLVNKFGTPLWLLDTGCIISTMNRLRDGFLAEYSRCEITYSVKTNYLAEILREVAANGYRLEVVSGHELALARQVGVASDRLLFNGPVKSSADLKLCHSNRIDVHVDSLDELSVAAELGSKSNPFRLGIRVAARLANGSTSRFGIDFEDANSVKTVRGLIAGNSVAVTGFHMHHSSRRNAQSCVLDAGDRCARSRGALVASCVGADQVGDSLTRRVAGGAHGRVGRRFEVMFATLAQSRDDHRPLV